MEKILKQLSHNFPLILSSIGLLVFGSIIFNGFVWDDEEQILTNTAVHSLANLTSLFQGSTFFSGGGTNLSGIYYKPLMMVVFSFLYTVFGPNAWAFHLFQLLFYIASALLLFAVFELLLKRRVISFLVTLLFLVHPINVETIAYISNLQDVLYFFFGISALFAILKRKDKYGYVFTALLLLFSLLSKETGILWFAIIAWYLVLFERKRFVSYVFSSGIALAIYAILRIGVAHMLLAKHGLAAISSLSLGMRIANIPAMVWYYAKTLFFPSTLAINQQWVVRQITFSTFYAPLLFVVFLIALFTIVTLLIVHRKPRFSNLFLFFLGWFVLSFLFHLQLFPLDLTVSDRWFYLPFAGLLGMIAVLVCPWEKRVKRFGEILLLLFFIYIGILSLRSFIRVQTWRNGLILYGHDVTVSKDAFDLENNYGVELFRKGEYEQARVHFERSIQLGPSWWTSYNNLGAYWGYKGDLVKAEILYRKSIDNGNYYLAYENYAQILFREKKYAFLIEFYAPRLKAFSQNIKILLYYAFSLYENGDQNDAIALMKELSQTTQSQAFVMLTDVMIKHQDILPLLQ